MTKPVASEKDGEQHKPTEEELAPSRKHVRLGKIFPEDGRIRSFARYCPLIAATLAPFSTLMDIPALSERWYQLYGVTQSDYKACIALSAVGLGLNLIANILLVMRFWSNKSSWFRYSTLLSTVFWCGKTAVAVLNLALFGALISAKPGYSFNEAFWCAVVSVIVAGVISIALIFHYTLGFDADSDSAVDVRMEGRKFMLSVTIFMVILGFQSLAFSRLEGWSYSDAIYFSTQTALTIGYGDLLPTTTASKVLVFCFSVLTISQLGNEIALIISFISARAEDRRDKWRRRYEGAMHREANAVRPKATLLEEMSLIYEINSREEFMNQIVDLIWSAISLIVFWVVGATIFSQLEGWTYGNAVYAVMVLSLTIGFGDFTPETPPGRVVFIVYALMAVPIVTSFAVQTITGLLSTYSSRGEVKNRFIRDRVRNPKAFAPHADYILHAHESYGEMRARLLGEKIAPEKIDPNHQQRHDKFYGDNNGKDPLTAPHNSNAKKEKRFGDHLKVPHRHPHETPLEEWNRRGYIEQMDHAETGSLNPFEQMVKKAHDQAESLIERRRSRESHINTIRAGGGGEEDGSGSSTYHLSEGMVDDAEETHELESKLMKQLMKLTIQLEAEARQMMLDSMDQGVARTLLLADRNVQERDVRAIRGDDADMIAIWRGEQDKVAEHRQAHPTEPASLDLLSRVGRYRNTFASILVLGSILQKLTGEDINRFERWRSQSRAASRVTSRAASPAASARRQERREMRQDIDKMADENFGGLTGLMFKHHKRQLRKGSLGLDDRQNTLSRIISG